MKYICEVEYENGSNAIVFIKAKNDMHLEYKMVEDLVETYRSLACIKGISYEPLKRWMFKKTYIYVGTTWSGRSCMQKAHDDWLKKKERGKRR